MRETQRPSKEERERAVFGRYAKVAGLPESGASIESRQPPEPDILFRPVASLPIAFELVEILDQGYSRSLSRQLSTADFCYQFLDKYPQSNAFRKKYPNADIFLAFSPQSTEHRRRSILPKLFEKLLVLPDAAADEVLEQDPDLYPILQYARIHRGRFNGPLFNATAAISVGDPTVDAIRDKLAKQYNTPHRVELVAYINNAAMFPDEIWLASLRQYLEGLSSGPFAAISVIDLRGGRDEIVARWTQDRSKGERRRYVRVRAAAYGDAPAQIADRSGRGTKGAN